MLLIYRQLVCFFKGHEYHRHYTESPVSPKWFRCSRCGKYIKKEKLWVEDMMKTMKG